RALRYGYRSSIAAPLRAAGGTFGALNVYATVLDAFDDNERDLLERLADSLAFGIEAVRTRKTLVTVREELDATERSRFEILEQSPSAWVALDREWRFLYVNSQAADLLGYPADAITGRIAWELFPKHVGMPMERLLRRTMDLREGVTLDEYSARL